MWPFKPKPKARSLSDYAIEFGGYLAKQAEQFRDTFCDEEADYDARLDALTGLNSAIYEFRKRAERAKQ